MTRLACYRCAWRRCKICTCPGRSCALRPALYTDGGTLCCHFNRDTTLVVFGTTMSAFWIVSLNSWMQTPVGFAVVSGKIMATDWLAIVFNPSFPYRFKHMLIASGLTASFVVAGVSAWQILKKVDSKATQSAENRAGRSSRVDPHSDLRRRLARTQHAETSTRKNRCDGPRDAALRHPRRVRPGRRHPIALRAGRTQRQDGRLDRSLLRRQ